jgi:hypothetical protein
MFVLVGRYNRRVQAESVRSLKEATFAWLLPGHGRRIRFPNADVRRAMFEAAATDLETYHGDYDLERPWGRPG